MRLYVCIHVCTCTACQWGKGVGKRGSHSELSLTLGTVQMAAASLGCQLPAIFCLLIYFDLTHQGRWLGGRRVGKSQYLVTCE